MSQELIKKIHEAFEPARLSVAGGDVDAIILGVTFGVNETSAIWFEQAGNYSLIHQMCRNHDEGNYPDLREISLFDPFRELVEKKELISAVMLYHQHNQRLGIGAGIDAAANWIIHEAALRQDIMVKMSFQMQMQQSMMANAPRIQPAGGIPNNGGRINLN